MIKIIATLDKVRHIRLYRELDFTVKAIVETHNYENIICVSFKPVLNLYNFE